MILFREQAPVKPVDPARIAAETVARIEAESALLRAAREREIADEEHRRRLDAIRATDRAAVRAGRAARRAKVLARARTLAPLLIVNAAAVYGQLDYAYREVAPQLWNMPSKIALAVMFALAVESVALYVGWHAHDALLQKAHATAARLRRWSYLIAGTVALINYAHFADGSVFKPTSAGVAFGLLSLLSPWLWGLHTRRAQHVQLLAEDRHLIDESGAEFSAARRRAFPWRTWQARRWSIDHGVNDPRVAWRQYNEAAALERGSRQAAEAIAKQEKAAERAARRAVERAEKQEKAAQSVAHDEAEPAAVSVPVAPVFLAPVSAPPAPVGDLEVGAPEPDETAGQKVRQDARATHLVESAVRAMRQSDPKMSQRQIAEAVMVSETSVRRILRRTPVVAQPLPESTKKVNGHVPHLVRAGHDEKEG